VKLPANLPITVIKLNPTGKEMFHYPADVVHRGRYSIKVSAYFNREDLPFHGIVLKKGDRFFEQYYSRRWYNIYEIYDRDTGIHKV
jgi:hypothetical protein